MSRPEKPIDWKLVDQLLMAGCLGTEIAANFDMHPDTLYRRIEEHHGMGFTAYCSEKRSKGNSLLRAKQFEKALEKDNTMMIWLGKQRLDQREPETKPPEYKHEADVSKVLDKWKKEEDNGTQPEATQESELLERKD